MKKAVKIWILTTVLLLVISFSIISWGISVGWGQWEETRKIWLPEKYSLTNRVNGTYVNKPRPDFDGTVVDISLEKYKELFNEGNITIATDKKVYYSIEFRTTKGHLIFRALQDFPSGDPVYPYEVEILTDGELKLKYFEDEIALLYLLAAFCSVMVGFGISVAAKKILGC
jgi:hypothetical protein